MFQSTLLLEGAFCGGKGYKKEKVGGDAHIAPPKQHLRSVLSSAATLKPSGGIRSLLSLSACGLPTPIVVLACICDADIRVFSGAGVSILPPLKGEGDQRSWWRGSAEIFCSCFRFHRRNPSVKPAACQLSTRHALRVPFQGILFCLVNFHQQNSPGGANRRLLPP